MFTGSMSWLSDFTRLRCQNMYFANTFRVPFAESMAETPQVRQIQATDNLCTWAKAERDALKLLTENACPSTAVLLGYKLEDI
jgi:hypothetical protein